MLFTVNNCRCSWIIGEWEPLRDWESVGIRLRPLGNASYVACLPLFCQGSKWLNDKSVWLVFRRSWVQIPAGFQIFSIDLFVSLSQQNIITILYCLVQWKWKSLFFESTDIDECAQDQDDCHSNGVCMNTIGSYTCQCNAGFQGDGRSCTGWLCNKRPLVHTMLLVWYNGNSKKTFRI